MDDTETTGRDAGPAVVVDITPRDYRARGVAALVVGLLLAAAFAWQTAAQDRSSVNPFWALLVLGYGVYCIRQARRQVTRTLLRIDRSGLRSGDGLHDRRWDGVVLVWVGSSTGLRLPDVTQPTLSLFTAAGVDFARRAGTRPKALFTIPVGAPWTVRTLCEQLRSITDAPVLSGRDISRAGAAAGLEEPGRA